MVNPNGRMLQNIILISLNLAGSQVRPKKLVVARSRSSEM